MPSIGSGLRPQTSTLESDFTRIVENSETEKFLCFSVLLPTPRGIDLLQLQ